MVTLTDADIIQLLSLIVLMADNPYSVGFFETIIGVHWGGGLAVEFFPGAE